VQVTHRHIGLDDLDLTLFFACVDEATISFWLDEITLVKTLTRLSSMLNAVPLEQKSTRAHNAMMRTRTVRPASGLILDTAADTALHGMLEQLNGGLSVGLYIPIARADEVLVHRPPLW
jgi:hypothetical protein